jgi:hypothetical protein
MTETSLKAFVAQARAWQPYLKARVRIGLAVFTDGAWSLWYSYTAFLPDIPDSVDTFTVETASIRAFRDVTVLNDENAATAAIAEILSSPETMKAAAWTANLAPTIKHLQFEYESLHPDRFAGPKRIPALTASWFNQQYRTIPTSETKNIDQELQLHEQPFDGFADLALNLNIPVGFDELNKRRFSEFVLISPVELLLDMSKEPHSELKNGELSLVVQAQPALSPDILRFGVKAFKQKGLPERLTLNSADVLRDAEGFLRTKHKLSSAEIPVVLVFVSLKDGDLLGKWFIRDFGNSFNDRMLLHRSLDARDQFKSSFFERPDQFEDRVLLLLTLIGLTALKYGKIQTDAPDILAISTARHVYVVECTTGDINSRGKLQRLSDRTKQIREKLSSTNNPPVGVVPVIFTSLTRKDTTMHWETAATFNIALVTRENIVNQLENLDANVSPDQLYNGTLSLVPTKKADQNGSTQ